MLISEGTLVGFSFIGEIEPVDIPGVVLERDPRGVFRSSHSCFVDEALSVFCWEQESGSPYFARLRVDIQGVVFGSAAFAVNVEVALRTEQVHAMFANDDGRRGGAFQTEDAMNKSFWQFF